MKMNGVLQIALPVLFLIACGNSEQQTEALSLNTSPEETLPPEPLVYYYFVDSPDTDLPAGSVVILPDILALAPAESDVSPASDPGIDLSSSLQAMIDDTRNQWTSENLEVTSISYDQGSVSVALDGEIEAAGDIVLVAFRMQVLLTVFANTSVDSAIVTLNGECIGNLGISHESEARPPSFAFTRADIESW